MQGRLGPVVTLWRIRVYGISTNHMQGRLGPVATLWRRIQLFFVANFIRYIGLNITSNVINDSFSVIIWCSDDILQVAPPVTEVELNCSVQSYTYSR